MVLVVCIALMKPQATALPLANPAFRPKHIPEVSESPLGEIYLQPLSAAGAPQGSCLSVKGGAATAKATGGNFHDRREESRHAAK